MSPKASIIRQYIADRGLSARAIATRLGVHPGHLQRVLTGEREGSRAFLKSVAEIAEAMPGRREERTDDVGRLIDAATHVFFLKRGDFESAICLGARRRRERE
jgi:transcriptional regulator with XRE-family HTH domain